MSDGGKGGSNSTKIYYGSIAGVVCAGPVDELVSLIVDGATVWPTSKHWANGIVDVPVLSYERVGGVGYSTLTFAAPHGLATGQKIVVSGCPDASFDTSGPTTCHVVSSYKINYALGGATTVGVTSASPGVMSLVVHYTLGFLVGYAGGIWQALSAHDGVPGTEPPNVTYWSAYSVLRSGSPNPYPFTVPNYGQAYFYWGLSNQVLDASGEAVLARNGHPPYRRQAVIVLKDFLLGQERQAAPNVEVVVRRVPTGGGVVAGAALDLDADSQANPVAAWAELQGDPVFGLGQAAGKCDATSWQAVADALAGLASTCYVSILLDASEAARALLAKVLAYYDGWMRFNSAGAIEAGRFLHGQGPPAFTADTTIDYTDLQNEIEWDADGWASTFNVTTVKFKDRARAFTDAPRAWSSGLNREIVGEPRPQTLERPWITRELQAAGHAAEYGKIGAQPNLVGPPLVVRAEKATAIGVGDLFLLTHDGLALSVICRCTEKTLLAPPSGLVSLRFANERGIAAVPYHATLPAPGEVVYPPPEALNLYQLVQPPPALTGAADFELVVLAARSTQMVRGLRPWLRVDDATLFQQLGEQTGWAVNGLVATTVALGSFPHAAPATSFTVNMSGSTVQGDLDALSATLSQDEINNNAVLVWVFDQSDPTKFEIMSLAGISVSSGVYTLDVVRSIYSTDARSLTAGDGVWIVRRSDVMSYTHVKFAAFEAAAAAAVFRLQTFTPREAADLTDTDLCPDVAFTFGDPYGPEVLWNVIQKFEPGDTVFADISNFTTHWNVATKFQLSFAVASLSGNIADVRVVARRGSNEVTVWSQNFAPQAYASCTPGPFVLGTAGTWQVFVVVRDSAWRTTWHELQPVGGGAAVHLQLGASGVVCMPIADPPGGAFPTDIPVAVSCDTAGATIWWKSETVNVDGSINSYSGYMDASSTPIYVFPKSLLDAGFLGHQRITIYASKSGLTDSPAAALDFWPVR